MDATIRLTAKDQSSFERMLEAKAGCHNQSAVHGLVTQVLERHVRLPREDVRL
ncbi:hypothetical protein DOTSEDRAFT_70093 [Dothistroma septosporum NZE10]|uniref:Uncharacterized protein n=1 Tax=Dothistroma septosporum (strain NZE10 / CBS 128990) TaxID=675120 RepID=N1PSQ7_DOTSN|nr:hypothetical protein DOTSEDRAFT_70093 [Dothistroma septosporum NZE10]